jgi:ribosomal-protein-alanine N-acetyltransferase
VLLRPLDFHDIDAILAIQTASPEAAVWTRGSYEVICDDAPNRCIVAENGEEPPTILGFGCFRTLGPEAELLNLAVLPDARRRGVGTLILREVMRRAAQASAAELFLEVRQSNAAARALYEGFGFRLAGTRPRYYAHPTADAMIYRIELLPNQDPPHADHENPRRA